MTLEQYSDALVRSSFFFEVTRVILQCFPFCAHISQGRLGPFRSSQLA